MPWYVGKVGDSRVVVGTSGIVYDRDCDYYDAANVKINISDNSGTKQVVGAKAAIQVINDKAQDISGVFDIQGGTFSSDVSAYVNPTEREVFGLVFSYLFHSHITLDGAKLRIKYQIRK